MVVDYTGSFAGEDEGPGAGDAGAPLPGGEGRDQLVELGGGNLLPGFEERLLGASAGETRTVELTVPVDYSSEELAGRGASFEVTVKEVKVKQLPDLDDDLAIDAGFDDLQQLREDIRRRLLELDEGRIEAEFRQAALDAAVAASRVELPADLVKARARELWERTLHSLSHRGISREAYLKVAGREESEIVAELEPDAELALRREAVLTAVVAAEQISPSDEELLEALQPTAEREETEPQKLFAQLRSSGRLEDAREDLAARQAVELIAARAKPISTARAQAREQLWTPGQRTQGEATGARRGAPAPGELWTPTERRPSS